MVGIQYWKMYGPYYGWSRSLGHTVVNAQADSFAIDGLGVSITPAMLKSTQSRYASNKYQHLFSGTTMTDFCMALFVGSLTSCLYGELDRFLVGDTRGKNNFASGGPAFIDEMTYLCGNTQINLSADT